MRVKVIPIVVDVLGTIPRNLDKGLEELEIQGRIKIILTVALSRSARILRSV